MSELTQISAGSCEIAIGGAGDPHGAIEALCGQLLDLYGGPVKLVVFRGVGDDFYSGQAQQNQVDPKDRFACNKQVELLLDIMSKAPFFSLSLINGRVDDIGADIAVTCDWRLVSETGQFCFVSHRQCEDVTSATRLSELIGSSKAFDTILRRRSIPAQEAIKIGLAMPIAQQEDIVQVIETHVEKIKKESIAIMRRAVRNAFSNDSDVERIVGSLAAAKTINVAPI